MELRKQEKTYSQIAKETGCDPGVITKVLSKAGLTRKRGSQTETPVPSGLVPSAPAAQAGGDWLKEFQPAPPKESRRRQFRADCCGAIFALDEGERIEDVKECPAGCGGVP